MTYVLAYQVAELSPYVLTLDMINQGLDKGEPLKYNSDKHATYDPDHLSPVYVRYLKAIGNDGDVLKQPFYITSYDFCVPGFDIYQFKHKSFPIDCRSIGAAGIKYLFDRQDNWKEMGVLKLGP